ncbi:MAG: hypothetical protein WD873_06480, partial [Candidatus Hydrogenedentales bacterium]
RLAPLFARSFPQARIHAHARRKDRAPLTINEPLDYQAPLGDLPRWLRPDPASFPDRPRHLVADERRVAQWRERFAELGSERKVGVSWQAGGQPHERRRRSTALAEWLPVFAVPGCQFINLQYGECADEIAAARKKSGIRLHDFEAGDPLVDLDDFAAKIAALDLVISVGNTTVHLAGALGVPVWALLPTVPGWRWLIAGERNPWYASVRAIRQTTTGDWRGVFAAAAARLREAVALPPLPLGEGRGEGQHEKVIHSTAPLPNPLPEGEGTNAPSLPRINMQKTRDRALDRFRAGDLETAERLFTEVLAHSPRDLGALHCLGQIAQQNG